LIHHCLILNYQELVKVNQGNFLFCLQKFEGGGQPKNATAHNYDIFFHEVINITYELFSV